MGTNDLRFQHKLIPKEATSVKRNMALEVASDGFMFEVICDVLYIDGQVFHRGDLLTADFVGTRAVALMRLGMVYALAERGYVA